MDATTAVATSSLVKDLSVDFAKTVAISAATTAGMVLGMAVVGQVLVVKDRRAAKKAAKNTPVTETV